MKQLQLVTKIVIILSVMTLSLNAQQEIIINNNIDQESSEIFIGVHSGFFDSNQHSIAYNIGVISKYHYIPYESGRWFLGGELGMFYASSKIDKLDRNTKVGIVDISVYPGYSIPIGINIKPDDTVSKRYKKLASARKLRFGLGLAIAIPVLKRSEGGGVNLNEIKPYIGFSLKSSYDLHNRISLFGSVTRIGRDLDGFAYRSETSPERSNGNKHDVTYYFKFGVIWNFIKK